MPQAPGDASFVIRPTIEADWREVRDLRLEMIRDTPIAFGETLDHAVVLDEEEWRVRARRGTAGNGVVVVAIDASRRWVGTMGGYVPDDAADPLLVGVYVAPGFRGSGPGITDALLAAVEQWARTRGDRLALHVHERNVVARRSYERRGFVATGHTQPYVLDPTAQEVEMVKVLWPTRRATG